MEFRVIVLTGAPFFCDPDGALSPAPVIDWESRTRDNLSRMEAKDRWQYREMTADMADCLGLEVEPDWRDVDF